MYSRYQDDFHPDGRQEDTLKDLERLSLFRQTPFMMHLAIKQTNPALIERKATALSARSHLFIRKLFNASIHKLQGFAIAARGGRALAFSGSYDRRNRI